MRRPGEVGAAIVGQSSLKLQIGAIRACRETCAAPEFLPRLGTCLVDIFAERSTALWAPRLLRFRCRSRFPSRPQCAHVFDEAG